MSLNGLDDPTITEAYQTALAEAGGWFLLKYVSRDEVAILDQGTGGVPEVRNAIDAYDENSPLYGFLQYRRRKVVLKYVHPDVSRLVQVRSGVHFQSVVDKFSPNDTVFSVSQASDLTEGALSSACLLHAASSSITSSSSSLRRRGLMGISEDAEENAVGKDEPQAEFSGPDKRQRPVSQLSEATVVPSRATLNPECPPSSNAQALTGVSEAADRSSESISWDHDRESLDPQGSFLQELSSQPSSEWRKSSQSARPALRDFEHTYMPKVKRGPRPSVDLRGRPRTAGSMSRSQDQRPVASLPPSVRTPSRQSSHSSSSRPQSQPSSAASVNGKKRVPPVPPLLLVPPSTMITSFPKPPLSPGTKSMSAVSSSGLTPEKERLMKALHLRRKQMEKQAQGTKSKNIAENHNVTPAGQDKEIHSVHAQNPPEEEKRDKQQTHGSGNNEQPFLDVQPSSYLQPHAPHAPVESNEGREPASLTSAQPVSDANMTVSDDSNDGDRPSDTSLANGSHIALSTTCDGPVTKSQQSPYHQTEAVMPEAPVEEDDGNDNNGSRSPSGVDRNPLSEDDSQKTPEKGVEEEEEAEGNALTLQRKEGPPVAVTSESATSVQPRNPEPVVTETVRDGPCALSERDNDIPKEVGSQIASEEEKEAEGIALSPQRTVSPSVASGPTTSAQLGTPELVVPEPPSQPSQPNDAGKEPAMEAAEPPEPQCNSTSGKLDMTQNDDRREKQNRHLAPPNTQSQESSDDSIPSDNSFIEELKSAKLEEATSVSVPKSTLLTPYPDNSSAQRSVDAEGSSRAVSNPTGVGRVSSNLQALAAGRSVSTSYSDSNSSRPVSPVPVARKINVSSGISSRIKALEKFSSNGHPNPTLATNTPAPPLEGFRKRASVSQYSGQPDIELSRRSSVMTTSPSSSTSRVPSRSTSFTDNSNATSNKPKPVDPSEQIAHRTQPSPFTAEHGLSETAPQSSIADPTATPSKKHTMPTTSAHSNGDIPATMMPEVDIRPKSSSNCPSPSPEEKKESRTSRLIRRMSSIRTSPRKNIMSPLSPTQEKLEISASLEEDPNQPSKAAPRAAPRVPRAVDIGEVNIQFPDTLLWKRRFMRIDDEGCLVLTPGNKDSTGRNMTKRYHLSEFQTPCLPDEDRQELPNSILLDFLDGSTLQCACESRQGQVSVLQTLMDAYGACERH